MISCHGDLFYKLVSRVASISLSGLIFGCFTQLVKQSQLLSFHPHGQVNCVMAAGPWFVLSFIVGKSTLHFVILYSHSQPRYRQASTAAISSLVCLHNCLPSGSSSTEVLFVEMKCSVCGHYNATIKLWGLTTRRRRIIIVSIVKPELRI